MCGLVQREFSTMNVIFIGNNETDNQQLFDLLVDYEITCSKRYRRLMSLLIADVQSNQESFIQKTKQIIRQSDCMYVLNSRIFILMPETDFQGAFRLFKRLGKSFPSKDIRFSISSFPRDGLTYREIIEKAMQGLQQQAM